MKARQHQTLRLSIPRFRVPHAALLYARPGKLLRSTLLSRQPLKAWLVYFAFVIYSLFGLLLFFSLVKPWIDGDTWTRIGADSDRYWTVARMLSDPAQSYGFSLVSFSGNFLGPVLVALALKYQFLVLLFNYLVFLVSLLLASTIRGTRTYLLLGLLMLNAETAITLITLNKEIFAILSAVLVAKYLLTEGHPWVYLALGLGASMVTRWEQAALVLVVAFLTRKNSFFARRHRLALGCFVGGITLAYSLLARFEGRYLSAFTQYTKGAGTIVTLNQMQASFGFPLVVVPKIIMNLLGELLRPNYYLGAFWEIGFMDLHSQIVLPLFSMALVCLLAVALAKGKLAVQRPISFLIAIYLVGTAVTPFIQPRYEYFVYVLLCVELARREPEAEPAPLHSALTPIAAET